MRPASMLILKKRKGKEGIDFLAESGKGYVGPSSLDETADKLGETYIGSTYS